MDLTGINYSDGIPDVSFTPDRLGRPTTITDGGGTLTRVYHSSLPVATTDTYASGHVWLPGTVLTHTWDADDARRTSVGLARTGFSYSTTAAYDGVTGRVAGYTGSNTFKHEYAYSSGTSLITATNHFSGSTARGTETRNTDLSGRLYGISTKNAAGATITRHGYTLDAAGRRTKATRENAEYWEYGYNDRGEVTEGKKHLPNGDLLAGHQFEYAYDAIGNRTSSKSGGTTTNGAGLNVVDYTNGGASPVNALNQYTAIKTDATFDVIGRTPVASGDSVTTTLTSVTRQGGHYDVKGSAANSSAPVWKAVDVTYTPASGPATTENGHLYVPKEVVTPAYDVDGNLTTDGRWTYTWDAENRLVSMTSLHNDKPRTRVLEFAYDWKGRRMEKKVSDEISSVMTVVDKRRFAYDGWNMISEFTVDGSGSLVAGRQYAWGIDLSGWDQDAGGVNGLLSMSDGVTPLIACYDGNGNIAAWIDASGTVVARQDYDPFGGKIIREGVEIPVGFSTKYEDMETGFLYYGCRYYDPEAGGWINRDPIGERGGLNLYGFVQNNPILFVDYLGCEITIPPPEFPRIPILPPMLDHVDDKTHKHIVSNEGDHITASVVPDGDCNESPFSDESNKSYNSDVGSKECDCIDNVDFSFEFFANTNGGNPQTRSGKSDFRIVVSGGGESKLKSSPDQASGRQQLTGNISLGALPCSGGTLNRRISIVWRFAPPTERMNTEASTEMVFDVSTKIEKCGEVENQILFQRKGGGPMEYHETEKNPYWETKGR